MFARVHPAKAATVIMFQYEQVHPDDDDDDDNDDFTSLVTVVLFLLYRDDAGYSNKRPFFSTIYYNLRGHFTVGESPGSSKWYIATEKSTL